LWTGERPLLTILLFVQGASTAVRKKEKGKRKKEKGKRKKEKGKRKKEKEAEPSSPGAQSPGATQ